MGDLKIWAVGVIASALAITVSEMLLPDGGVKKTAKMAFSLVLILVVLSPIVSIVKQPDYAIYNAIQQSQKRFQKTTAIGVKNEQTDYNTSIIVEYEKNLNAYIKNEAKTFGGICNNVRLLINRDAKSEKFGMVEMMEIDVSGGDETGLRNQLAKTFSLGIDMVKVRSVN